MNSDRRAKLFAWTAFFSWLIIILALIPWANAVRGGINQALGPQGVRILAIGAALTLGCGGVFLVERLRPTFSAVQIAWCVAILGAAVAWMFSADIAAEPAHVVEYSLLSVLAWNALSRHIGDASVFVSAALLTSLAGTLDETIQWLTPDRYWDVTDLALNAIIGAAAQFLLAQGLRPARTERRFTASGVRLALGLAFVHVVLVGLSLSNTPQRIYRYAPHVPGLAEHGLDASTRMADYGFEFRDPEIGLWRSRLPLAEITRIDAERGGEAGAIFARFTGHASFGDFHREYPPGRDPFLSEAREHLFHRDRYRNSIPEASGDSERRLRATRAWRENLILERYYPTVIDGAGLRLPPQVREELSALHDPAIAFDSPVGKPVMITAFGEAEMRIVVLAALVILILAGRFVSRRAW